MASPNKLQINNEVYKYVLFSKESEMERQMQPAIGRVEKCIPKFNRRNLKRRDYLGDLGIEEG
jgi:hypothetical protein